MLPIKNDPRKWESSGCKAAFIASLLAQRLLLLVFSFSVLETSKLEQHCVDPL